MSHTYTTMVLFVLVSFFLLVPVSKAQTSINFTPSGISVISDGGAYGFTGSDGLSLSFGSATTSDGTNYTDTSGSLSFIDSSGNIYTDIPVSGVTTQTTSQTPTYEDVFVGYQEVFVGYQYCGLFCGYEPIYEYEPVYQYEEVGYYGNQTDIANGNISPGNQIMIGNQEYQITGGTYSFDYTDNYAGGVDGNYSTLALQSGNIDLQLSPAPEPSTAVLWLTGIVLMILTRKRIGHLLQLDTGTHRSLSPH